MFYTYYIKAENKYYFGSRTPEFMLNKDAKDDFMIHYFSSTTDERLREIIKNKEYEKAEIIKEYTDRQECLKDEERLIKLFWAFYGRLNCWNHYADKKFSMSGRPGPNLGKKLSEEIKQKLSEAKKGKTSTFKGRKHTAESKKKMSELHKGKTLSVEHKKKIGNSCKGERNGMYGRNHTTESKKKMSESLKGKPSSFKGKHHSEETKQKLSEANKGIPSPHKGIPQQKFYWQTLEGEIKIMDIGNAHRYHPDWTLIGPIENNENN